MGTYKITVGFGSDTWHEEIVGEHVKIDENGSLHITTARGVVKYNKGFWLKCDPVRGAR